MDSKWHAMYGELQQFPKENGHSQPGLSTHSRLCKWTRDQQAKHQKGLLSTEQVKLLGKLDFSWEPKSREWQKMCNGLTEYFNTRGHIQVGQEEEPELYDWMDLQRKRCHGMDKRALSDEQIERLEDLHFCWSLDWRDRA